MADDGLYSEPRIAVSIGRKINLGNYESVDLFMAVSGLEAGASDEVIKECLVTGERAFELLKESMRVKMMEVRRGKGNLD